MSQNLLPFEWTELKRYGFSFTSAKLLLLRRIQSRSFRAASGAIFLTAYAKEAVLSATGPIGGLVATIPHGLNRRFLHATKGQQAIDCYSAIRPLRLLYVSIAEPYKHQWHLVDAVSQLRSKGYPVTLDLVGPAHSPSLKRLRKAISEHDPMGKWVTYHGAIPYEKVHEIYAGADVGVFASSCENMPNILLETMAAGLPIACSDRGPMPEVLKNGGVYFDPEDADSIASAIRVLLDSADMRTEKAGISYALCQDFSWERCASETFSFLSDVARIHRA